MAKEFIDRRKSSIVDAATLKFAGLDNRMAASEDSEAGYLKKDLDEQYKIREYKKEF